MSTSQGVVSKNLYEILGNDPELDPDRPADPPVKVVDKTGARTGKRNAPTEAPTRDSAAPRGGRGGRDNATGSELAFRDRGAGSNQNRSKPTDEFRSDRHPNRLQDGEQKHSGGRGRSRGQGGYRGGRGGGGGARDDRHSKTGVTDSDKQAGAGWGAQTGADEWADEKAGEAIAQADEKEETTENATADVTADGEAAAPEPEEDKTKSYTAWLAEQEEKRAALSGGLEIRKANEGSSKKQPEGKAISREEEEDFMAGSGGKAKRERTRKEKTLLELDDQRLHSAPQESGFRGGRGGRGRGRGDGPPRGEGRGRGDGSFRGEGRGRGGRGRATERGDFRGGRGGRGVASPNVNDDKAFPSLGA